jgi:uncharacterized membrane protein
VMTSRLLLSLAAEGALGLLAWAVSFRFGSQAIPAVQLGIVSATSAGALALVVKARLLRPKGNELTRLNGILAAQGLSLFIRLAGIAVALFAFPAGRESPIFLTLTFFCIYLLQQPIEMRYVLQQKATTS